MRANLVLEAIAKAENVQVTDEEVEEELKKLAEQYNRELDEIKRLFEQQGGLDQIKEELVIRKTIDLLVSNSKNAA